MDGDIPEIIELIYRAIVPGPNPAFWPERLKDDPQLAHSMWTFYHETGPSNRRRLL